MLLKVKCADSVDFVLANVGCFEILSFVKKNLQFKNFFFGYINFIYPKIDKYFEIELIIN